MHYEHGRYHVDVAPDGAIKVMPNDWLSKYSAAIHNDFWHVNEFGRKNQRGGLDRIVKVDLIRTGEVIYHLPTLQKALKSPTVRRDVTGPPPTQMSEAEKKKLTIEILKKEFGLRGEHGHILEKAYEIVHVGDTAVTMAEIAGILGHSTVAAAASTTLSCLGAVLFQVMAAIQFWNALETSEKLYGMRAVAYTITAWAFDQTPPTQSDTILRRLSTYPLLVGHGIPEHHAAWKVASSQALANLAADVVRRKTSKKAYQTLLRALGENDKETLCYRIMQGLEARLKSPIEKLPWIGNYTVLYPE